jgi:hypothetical protein
MNSTIAPDIATSNTFDFKDLFTGCTGVHLLIEVILITLLIGSELLGSVLKDKVPAQSLVGILKIILNIVIQVFSKNPINTTV